MIGFNFKLFMWKFKLLILFCMCLVVDLVCLVMVRSLFNCVLYEFLFFAIYRLAFFCFFVDRGGSLIRKFDCGVMIFGSFWLLFFLFCFGFFCIIVVVWVCFCNLCFVRRVVVFLFIGGRVVGVDFFLLFLLYVFMFVVEVFVVCVFFDFDFDDVDVLLL